MLRSSKLSVLTLAVALASCGADKKETKTEAPAKVSEESAKAEGAKLPAVAIVKVPIGADGKELNDQAEMRLVAGEAALTSSNIESTFSAAVAPEKTVDELDQTSSTESFCGWISWALNFRRNHFPSYTNWNWSFYRPTYLNYGYNYGYNYGGQFGNPCAQQQCGGFAGGQGGGGYNYYYYNRSFSQTGYSGQGWNPGDTYNPNGNFGQQQGQPYGQPGQVGQQPGQTGHPQDTSGFPQQPGGFPQQPGGFPQQPGGFPQQPGSTTSF